MALLSITDHDSEASQTTNSKSDPDSANHSTFTLQQCLSQQQMLVAEKQFVPVYKADKANTRTEARYTLYNYIRDVNHGNSDSDPDILPVRCRMENVVETDKNMRRNRREIKEAEARRTLSSPEGVKESGAMQNQGSDTHSDKAKEDGNKPEIKRQSSMLEIYGMAD